MGHIIVFGIGYFLVLVALVATIYTGNLLSKSEHKLASIVAWELYNKRCVNAGMEGKCLFKSNKACRDCWIALTEVDPDTCDHLLQEIPVKYKTMLDAIESNRG